MNARTSISTIIVAAVVLVVLPLLVALSTIIAHALLAATGGDGLGIFARMGVAQTIVFAWSVVAIGVVGALIAALIREHSHAAHA